MKKYSSYKNIKPPLNTSSNFLGRTPQSPTHSTSYRKLNAIDLSSHKPHDKPQMYPMSAKYSNYINFNSPTSAGVNGSNRKKMFSSKNHQTPQQNERAFRTLALNRQEEPHTVMSSGLNGIKSKIDNLESRLNEIKKNYDISSQNRKNATNQSTKPPTGHQDRSLKMKDENRSFSKVSKNNKENETPKEKDKKHSSNNSKLLLDRFNNNKRLSKGGLSSASTMNLNSVHPRSKDMEGRPPLSPNSPKNMIVGIKQNTFQGSQISRNSQVQKADFGKNGIVQAEELNSKPKKTMSSKESALNKVEKDPEDNSYLKQYVTTFNCPTSGTQPKAPLGHSTSEKVLYKAKNNLTLKKQPNQKSLYYVSAILEAHLTDSPTSFDQLCRSHMTTSLEILTYIKSVKKQPPPASKVSTRPLPATNKISIVFDLDETLIHCNENASMPHDVALPIKFPNGAILKAGINVRPYARECIKELSKYFEIIVFTASHECYGNVIVDYLDPKGEIVKHRYFRDSCHKTEEGFYIKDLRVIDRDLSKMLLIDNAAYSYAFQLENGIPIVPFYDNKADLQLKNLIPYIKQFQKLKDVRPLNSESMKLKSYTNFKDIKTLISKLYSSE